MVDKIDAIEEINKKRKTGEVTDAARDAIMQAAMNKANPNANNAAEVDMAAAAQDANVNMQNVDGVYNPQQASEVNATQQAKEAEEVDLSKGSIIGKTENPERAKTVEKMLTSSMDQLALNNLNNLNFNPKKDEMARNTLNETMMQVAMDKANPNANRSADKDMANVAQGTTAIADTAKKDEANIQTQQIYETGDSVKMQEAKESGLSVGVKIEQPDETKGRQQSPEKLLSGSMEQLAARNMADLGMVESSTETDA